MKSLEKLKSCSLGNLNVIGKYCVGKNEPEAEGQMQDYLTHLWYTEKQIKSMKIINQ